MIFILQGRDAQYSNEKTYVSTGIERLGEIEKRNKLEDSETGDVVAIEDRMLLPSFKVSLNYEKYLPTYTYFLVEAEAVNIHSEPSVSGKVIYKASQWEKLNYIESVLIKSKDDSIERWYHVTWDNNGEPYYGFVKSDVVTRRYFQFDKMEKAILKAEDYAKSGRLTFINNYQNLLGYAPLYKGGTVDDEGNRRSQSAPGYPSLSNKEDFIYIEDGTLVRYLFPNGEHIKVEVVDTAETYYVPKKYIPVNRQISNLKKVIVVDRENQNEAVYEKIYDEWTLISYTFATTGDTGKYAVPTSLGFYYGIEKRSQFYYYEDGTTRIQGYAPYAIRFAGGAYIHGVPVSYRFNDSGERITPPKQEYSQTIGSVPLSHKCVRNYTSHAKFLYNWYTEGETIVVVIE